MDILSALSDLSGERMLILKKWSWGWFHLRWNWQWRHSWGIKDFRKGFIRLWLGPFTFMAEWNPPRLEER